MKVAAFQFDVHKGDVPHNLRAVEEGLRAAAADGVRLVVCSEMWPTSFAPPEPELLRASDAALERVRELSAELALTVCGSAYATPPETSPGARPRNRLHVFAEGRALAFHDKVHLFSPTAERELFSAGDAPPPVCDSPLGRLAGVVCYDLRFGPLVQVAFEGGAEVLVVPAQWPAPRAAHWRALLIGRAVEGQLVVVGANRTGTDSVGRSGRPLQFPGNSLVADGTGAVLAEGDGREGLVKASVDPELLRRLRRAVPVARDRRPECYVAWRKAIPGREPT